ncbi:hypothetical protein [Rummeliibacillus pycnus]|uniref:hypothetical protein n=1 Tax=Rummeliibacillus pycnus TaxID=101070 RepID=UPI003D2D2AF4
MKRFLSYFIWVIILAIAIYLGLRFRVYLGNEAETTYNSFPIMIFTILFPMIIGILLRIPKFLDENKGKKKWSFDWLKLIIIACPALYVALLPYLIYTSYGEKLFFAEEAMLLGETTTTLTTITGIIFGYIMIDSVKMK